MNDFSDIDKDLHDAEKELARLDAERDAVQKKINLLKTLKSRANDTTMVSLSESEKIRLFRSLFKGRDNVYPKRFESKKTGKSGIRRTVEMNGFLGYAGSPK